MLQQAVSMRRSKHPLPDGKQGGARSGTTEYVARLQPTEPLYLMPHFSYAPPISLRV